MARRADVRGENAETLIRDIGGSPMESTRHRQAADATFVISPRRNPLKEALFAVCPHSEHFKIRVIRSPRKVQ